MTHTHDLVRRHVAAFNAHDVALLLEDFAPRATWVTGKHRVPEGELPEFFASAMQGLTPHLELHRIIDGGDTVAAEMTETWAHDGAAKSAALMAVFDLANGKIVRAKIYREGSSDA